jgi:hypothetical protein
MTKYDLILSIQGKQRAANAAVLDDETLNSYSLSQLEDIHINLSTPDCLIDFDTARKLLESLRNTGGASYSPFTGIVNPDKGYMVALLGYEKQVSCVWNTIDLKHVINYWLTENGMNGDKNAWQQWNAYLGLWEDNGKLYLDISQNITDEKVAVRLGEARKQICIYDCANKRVIKTS